MSQVLCPSCATPLNANDQFCGGCGMRVTGALPQAEQPQGAPAQPAQPAWPQAQAQPQAPQQPWPGQAQPAAQQPWPQQPQPAAQQPWPGQAPQQAQQPWPQQAQPAAQQAWPGQAAQQPWPQQGQAPAQQPWPGQPQAYQNQQAQAFGVDPMAGSVVPAGFGIRLLAFLIDGVILSIPQWLGVTGVLATIVSAAYAIAFWVMMNGQTPGKMVLGLRVVPVDGKPLDWTKAGLRYVGYLVSGIILGIGFLMIAFDSKKQGLHDKISGTVVVRKA